MPSISDVFNELVQCNTRLQQLHNDAIAEKASTDAVKASTDSVKNSVDQVSNKLTLLISGQNYANLTLFHLSQQIDTMICILENISRNTCSLLNEAHAQTRLQTAIQGAVSDDLEIDKYAYPAAALELSRLQALRRQIEECCPPPVPEPVCTYEPCKAPEPLKEPKRDPSRVVA